MCVCVHARACAHKVLGPLLSQSLVDSMSSGFGGVKGQRASHTYTGVGDDVAEGKRKRRAAQTPAKKAARLETNPSHVQKEQRQRQESTCGIWRGESKEEEESTNKRGKGG